MNNLFSELSIPEKTDIEFADIFNIEYLQQLQDSFTLSTGVLAVLIYPDGTPITKVSNYCGKCQQAEDQAHVEKHLPGMKINFNCVSGGVWSQGAPIVVQDKHLATWLIANRGNVEIDTKQQSECVFRDGGNVNAQGIMLSEIEFKRINNMFLGFVNGIAANAQKDLLLKHILDKQEDTNELLLKNEERYQAMLATLYEGIIVVQDGLLQYCNPRILDMTGCTLDEMLGHSIVEFIHPDDVEMVVNNYKLRIQGAVLPQWYTFRLLSKKSDFLWIEISGCKIEWNGRPATINTFIEVTERKLLADALAESEEKFRQIAENSFDGILTIDPHGKVLYSSPSFKKHFSSNAIAPLTMQSIYELIHPEDRDELFKKINEAIALKKAELSYIYRSKHKDKIWMWREDNASFMYDENGKHIQTYVICRDITERKQAENERNKLEMIRQLNKHTEKVREKERLSISHDLHDDIGQMLTAIKIDLRLAQNQTTDQNTASQIEATAALVSSTLKTVQRLTSELRPFVYENTNVVEAFRLFSNGFMARYGIDVFLKTDKNIDLSKEASSVVIPIFQEALTNVARHAKAKTVDVLFNKMGKHYELRISDNGIGIKPSDIESETAYGILGMKERATSIGGKFEIRKMISGGTVVTMAFEDK